jgi:hypothetical protein
MTRCAKSRRVALAHNLPARRATVIRTVFPNGCVPMNDSNREQHGPTPLTSSRYQALLLVIALCFLNFAAFAVVAYFVGGDAGNGKVVEGNFYLGYKGKFTEVSEGVYAYSLWHLRSLAVTFPLSFVALFFVRIEQDRRRREITREQAQKGGYPHWPTT